jgi:hypothetical protein
MGREWLAACRKSTERFHVLTCLALYQSFHTATCIPTAHSHSRSRTCLQITPQSDEDIMIDLVQCIERMEDLMEDLQKNRELAGFLLHRATLAVATESSSLVVFSGKLRPIVDDNEADVALWNKEIAKYFRGKDFMNAPWLFAEAYKYRRLHECFSVSKYWRDYDVFFRQKVRARAVLDF